jgi:three-Cys-motif partner protein
VVKKGYNWTGGAELGEHSRRKHKIIREYLIEYVRVRCQLPQRARFRLGVVDGFAGGGRYDDGSPGSPIVIIEALRDAAAGIAADRAASGMARLKIECLLILNDQHPEAYGLMKEIVPPVVAAAGAANPDLRIEVEYFNASFAEAYKAATLRLQAQSIRNALYYLDQYGHAHVERRLAREILGSFESVEVYVTLGIEPLLAFLPKQDDVTQERRLGRLGLNRDNLAALRGPHSHDGFLGAAERLVFGAMKGWAPFVSPFSIQSTDGWRYWLLQFAKNHRARQVYNDVLHANGSLAHFGRSGLDMLAYDARQDEASLYLFDDDGRARARGQLHDDVGRKLNELGGTVIVRDFYEAAYSATPAHHEDIAEALIRHPEIAIQTPQGGERRVPGTIDVDDRLILRPQRTFVFPSSKPGG